MFALELSPKKISGSPVVPTRALVDLRRRPRFEVMSNATTACVGAREAGLG